MSDTQARRQLLELPSELRNQIYTLVLIAEEGNHINVTSSGYERPALLSVCKEIRQDALPLFFGQNIFCFDFISYKTDDYQRFRNIHDEISKQFGTFLRHTTTFEWPREANWTNLMAWLERYHYDENYAKVMLSHYHDMSPQDVEEEDLQLVLIRGLFGQVNKLRALPWEQVKTIVEEHRFMLTTFDESWATT